MFSLSGEGVSPERVIPRLLLVTNPRAIATCVAYGSEALFSGLTYKTINDEKSVFKGCEIM